MEVAVRPALVARSLGQSVASVVSSASISFLIHLVIDVSTPIFRVLHCSVVAAAIAIPVLFILHITGFGRGRLLPRALRVSWHDRDSVGAGDWP